MSVKRRIQVFELGSHSGAPDRAAKMRARRERHLALTPDEQVADQRTRFDAAVHALAEPEGQRGTPASEIQELKRRIGGRLVMDTTSYQRDGEPSAFTVAGR